LSFFESGFKDCVSDIEFPNSDQQIKGILIYIAQNQKPSVHLKNEKIPCPDSQQVKPNCQMSEPLFPTDPHIMLELAGMDIHFGRFGVQKYPIKFNPIKMITMRE